MNLDEKYMFWAREPEDARKENFAHDVKIIIHNGRLYTPFSNKYDSITGARQFLNRNGEFWAKRGVYLQLFKGNEHVAIVNKFSIN